MLSLGFWPLFEYPNRCDRISSCWWANSEISNVDKGVTTLAMNINLNSYMENIKYGAL